MMEIIVSGRWVWSPKLYPKFLPVLAPLLTFLSPPVILLHVHRLLHCLNLTRPHEIFVPHPYQVYC